MLGSLSVSQDRNIWTTRHRGNSRNPLKQPSGIRIGNENREGTLLKGLLDFFDGFCNAVAGDCFKPCLFQQWNKIGQFKNSDTTIMVSMAHTVYYHPDRSEVFPDDPTPMTHKHQTKASQLYIQPAQWHSTMF